MGLSLSAELPNRFPVHYGLWKEKFLKHILTYLYCTKYNNIIMRHSHIKQDTMLFSTLWRMERENFKAHNNLFIFRYI